MPKRKALAVNAAGEQPKVEETALVEMTEAQKRAALIPTFKDGQVVIRPEQLDAMKGQLCTEHGHCLQGAVNAATAANCYKGEVGDSQKNVALRLLLDLKPQNAMERMLCAQLIATDQAASLCMGIGTMETNGHDARRKYLSLACQFQGLQVRQLEALAKLRTGGRQHVTVEHVTVEAGAQAVIGNVNHAREGGGGAGGGK